MILGLNVRSLVIMAMTTPDRSQNVESLILEILSPVLTLGKSRSRLKNDGDVESQYKANILNRDLTDYQNLRSTLLELHRSTVKNLKKDCKNHEEKQHSFYKVLVDELESVGWKAIRSADPDLAELQLVAVDESNQEHILKVALNSDYPATPHKYSSDLPSKLDASKSATSIDKLYENFVKTLSKYEKFFNMMKDVQTKAWILEPENLTNLFTDNKFRIALSDNLSVRIEVDPQRPELLPVCKFVGPDSAVQTTQEVFNRNVALWDQTKNFLTNLETVLEIHLPTKDEERQDLNLECGICYTYSLEGSFPDEICNNCNQKFHRQCLYEWLLGLPKSRQSFNVIFGDCPYCSKPVTVKMISL